MNRRLSATLLLLVGGAVLGGLWVMRPSPPRTAGRLSQDAYVWQRAWVPAVREAVAQRADSFRQLIVLGAEIQSRQGRPITVPVAFDVDLLKSLECAVGVALRIGSYGGDFSEDAPMSRLVRSESLRLLEVAREEGLRFSELQLDFDCAESKLAGYCLWVEMLQRAIPEVPIVVTALPSWLDRRAFRTLISMADGYVLQVHSLVLPKDLNESFTVCRPEQARAAVEQAARLKRAFRVALPTYGYELAFDPDNQFLGIAAEGESPWYAQETQLRRAVADPKAMGELVAAWTADRPESLQGVIWYRLPVEGDRLNWAWPTLRTVMEGESPAAVISISLRWVEPELLEVDLINQGTDRAEGDCRVILEWDGALMNLLAGDAYHDLLFRPTREGQAEFTGWVQSLLPGSKRTLGWIRFPDQVDVQGQVTLR